MKPLRIFRANGNCGCGSTSSQTLSLSGACADPAAGAAAMICDPKYFSLGTIVKMRLLGVPLGGNCQLFLKSANIDPRGFVFMDSDGQVFIENAPKLTLPFFNPAVDGVFPFPGGFSYIMIGTGADPVPWRFLAAPTVGEFSLQCVAGQWLLRDVTAGSGNTAVCSSGAVVDKVNLFGCMDTGELDEDDEPIFALRKLSVAHNRLIVGDIDAGVSGHKQLPDITHVTHPLAMWPDMKVGKYQQTTDADPDNEALLEADGMKVQVPVDADPVVLCGYNTDTNKFERLAARTKETLTVDADVGVADSGAYVEMGAHAKLANIQFNFPDFFISCNLRVANDDAPPNYAAIDYGLFIDGVQVHTWDVKGSKDATMTLLYKGIAIGAHTVAVRFRQSAAAGATTIKYSNTDLFTVL